MGGGGPSLEEINALLQFVAAVLFLWGSWKFYRGNYPAAREQLHRDVQALTAKGAEPLGWCARYFTFSNELWGSWLFALACVPYPAIGVAYLCAADGSEADEFVGWTYVTGGLAMVAGMAFWALTLSPDALAQNGGGGSTVLYDTLCCCGSEKCRAACGSDFLFMLWIVLVLLVPSVPILVLYAALRPTAMNICYAASIAVLTWGCRRVRPRATTTARGAACAIRSRAVAPAATIDRRGAFWGLPRPTSSHPGVADAASAGELPKGRGGASDAAAPRACAAAPTGARAETPRSLSLSLSVHAHRELLLLLPQPHEVRRLDRAHDLALLLDLGGRGALPGHRHARRLQRRLHLREQQLELAHRAPLELERVAVVVLLQRSRARAARRARRRRARVERGEPRAVLAAERRPRGLNLAAAQHGHRAERVDELEERGVGRERWHATITGTPRRSSSAVSSSRTGSGRKSISGRGGICAAAAERSALCCWCCCAAKCACCCCCCCCCAARAACCCCAAASAAETAPGGALMLISGMAGWRRCRFAPGGP